MSSRKYFDAELAACARRELQQRIRVYGRLVGEHKMTADKARHEINMMREIAEIFEEKNQPNLI